MERPPKRSPDAMSSPAHSSSDPTAIRAFVAAPLNLSSPPRRPAVTMIQFSDRPHFDLLMVRNEQWAQWNGYRYLRRSKRILPSHSVYFEKVQMALSAFDDGAEWVLWADDDAMINRVSLTVADWIDRFPRSDFIIAREVNLKGPSSKRSRP